MNGVGTFPEDYYVHNHNIRFTEASWINAAQNSVTGEFSKHKNPIKSPANEDANSPSLVMQVRNLYVARLVVDFRRELEKSRLSKPPMNNRH